MAEIHERESSVFSLAKTLGNVVHARFFRAFLENHIEAAEVERCKITVIWPMPIIPKRSLWLAATD
jgi:hypothetical protein